MTIWLQKQDQSDLLVHRGHFLLSVLQLLSFHLLVQNEQSRKRKIQLRCLPRFHRKTRWIKKHTICLVLPVEIFKLVLLQMLFLIAKRIVWKIKICKHKNAKWSQREYRRSRRMKFGEERIQAWKRLNYLQNMNHIIWRIFFVFQRHVKLKNKWISFVMNC